MYLDMYVEAMDGLQGLVRKEAKRSLTFVAEVKDGKVRHKMEHLACFLPGTLMLGAFHS
jgi:hypothetical protein